MIPAVLALSWLASQNDLVVQETGGRVVLEVERCAPSGDWKSETELGGFSGASYYTWRGPDLFGAPGRGVLSYAFTVGKAGVYHLRIQNRHDDADSTLHNDCFTRMDGGEWIKTYSSERGRWTWNTNHEDGEVKQPARYVLGPGVHVLEISGRSSRFSIDRLHLYRDGTAAEEAPAPSPTLLEAMAGPGPYGRAASHAAKLRAGKDLGRVLAALRKQADGDDGERMLQSFSRYAEARLEDARALREGDPAAAVGALEALARAFDGDEIGEKAEREADALRREPRVQTELKAEARWRLLEEGKSRLRPWQGRRDVRSEGFRRLNAAALAALRAQAEQLQKSFPETAAAGKAREFLKELR